MNNPTVSAFQARCVAEFPARRQSRPRDGPESPGHSASQGLGWPALVSSRCPSVA
jgi:hypothetical protein